MEPMVLIAFLSDTWCTVEPMGGHNGALNGGMMPNDSSRGVESVIACVRVVCQCIIGVVVSSCAPSALSCPCEVMGGD